MTLAVDWSQPWLAPWRDSGQRVVQAIAEGAGLHDALNAEAALHGPAPVSFVPHSMLPPGKPYERYIFHSKQCPVCMGLHDFFNGLCWLRFPQTKTTLNQLQAQAITQLGVSARRGPLRDAITLFDENAALLMAPPDVAAQIWPALFTRDWQRLFLDLRPLWSQVQPIIFGHALLEKLVSPRKAVTAHVFITQFAITSIANLDAAVSASLSGDQLTQKPFAPLQVLGVPGWWPENEAPGFYNDPKVFRVVP